MVKYAQHVAPESTPQSEPLAGQVANSAGGHSFPVDDWVRADRFLILGSEGGSYYASERKLTKEGAESLKACLKQDGRRLVQRIVEISQAGRAPKNDPAIFALALAASDMTSVETRRAAVDALPLVCRTATHLFQFNEEVEQLRGRGRMINRGIRRWYTDKDPAAVAYQCVKYRQRNGWSHRDLLRLARPKVSGSLQDVFYWVVKGWPGVGEQPHPDPALRMIWAMERAKKATNKEEICKLIRDHGLVRECIPTHWLNEAEVWDALLEHMPMTAMLRNLATMTRVGLLTPLSDATREVALRLLDSGRLKSARLHPISLLVAARTYSAGYGLRGQNTWTPVPQITLDDAFYKLRLRGQNTWTPVPQITAALDDAFYKTFTNVEPTGKRWYLAFDVSGSMWSGTVTGVPDLTPGEAAGAMGMVTAAVEKEHYTAAFNTTMWPFTLPVGVKLPAVCQMMAELPWGGTDCAQPILDATLRKIPVDVFVVYTDSETWAGGIHPSVALCQYRQKMGIPAKLIVVGMVSNGFTIADPNDAGMMDVVGFDTDTPALMAHFATGQL